MKENISLHKAFAIIEYLSKNGEQSILKLSEDLNMNKSTVYRFLATLCSLGYVQQDPSNKQYSLTFKFSQIGREKDRNQVLISQVRPYMESLSLETGESVHLAVLEGSKALYIDQVESRNAIRVNVEVGKTLPAYSVGVGKAMLAYRPEKEVSDLFEKETFIRFTEKTIRSLDELLKELKQVRKRGYSFDNEECMADLACIAVPLFSFGDPVAAVSLTFPRFRYKEGSDEEQKLVDQVVASVKNMNTRLS